MRIKILRVIVGIFFVAILVALFYLQVIRGDYYFRLSSNNRIRVIPLQGVRGLIKDRNGVILADNHHSFDVMIVPQELKDPNEVFSFLGKDLNIAPNVLAGRYGRRKMTPFAPVLVAENITREQAITLEENQYLFPAILIEDSFRRVYPQGRDSAHVLGYVSKINDSRLEDLKEYGYSMGSLIGYSGVEEYYDPYLQGVGGGVQIEVNSRGRQVRLLGIKEPGKGQDITLAVDSRIQKVSADLLAENKGAIVVMDMDSGEILGLSSSPGFDPNIFSQQSNLEISKLFVNPQSPLINRVIHGAFPPGSVFKIVVSLCALESKKINSYTRFICDGFYEVGGTKFGCTHNHGSQNMIEAIAHSCNVYFYHAGKILGSEMLSEYAHLLGLGRKTQIDLPSEDAGFVPNSKMSLIERKRRWYLGDTLNFSIGQGEMQSTPLQLTLMMSIIANDGKVVHPHVVKAIGYSEVDKFHDVKKLSFDPEDLSIIKKGMRAAVTDPEGTAHILDIEGLSIAGKTGTAQAAKNQPNHAWFAGYLKTTKKHIAFCVLLENGGSSYNSCLLAKELILFMQREKII